MNNHATGALAALVQAAIFSVIDWSPFRYAYHASKSEFFIMTSAFIVTLALGIDKVPQKPPPAINTKQHQPTNRPTTKTTNQQGILAGVALSIVALVRRTSHPRLKVLGVCRASRRVAFRDVTRYRTAQEIPGLCILRIDESVNFASCASIKDQLLHIARDPGYVRRHHRGGVNGGGNVSGISGWAPSPLPSFLAGPGGAASPVVSMLRSRPAGLGGGLRSNQTSVVGSVEGPCSQQQSEEPRPRPETIVVDFSGVNHVDLVSRPVCVCECVGSVRYPPRPPPSDD